MIEQKGFVLTQENNLRNFIGTNRPQPPMNHPEKSDPAKDHGSNDPVSMDEVFLEKIKKAIDENLETRNFGVDELGKEIGMSRSQIHRKMQALGDISPSKYIRTRKLQKAREYLQKNVGNVSEISFRLGFSSPAYFTQVYTAEFGYPPSEEERISPAEAAKLILSKDGKGSTRKLAAIMFTDIVGYTTLMGKNEQKGLEILRQSREIQKPLVEANGGKWLKEMGDGVLTQFDSAYDCVLCALRIQRAATMGFEAKIRIGIHLGDITIEGDDVFGDGVNIASRLQDIADPGGIYISESIQKALRGRSEIQYQHLGEIQLKNVDYLVNTFCLVDESLPSPAASRIQKLRASSIRDTHAPLSNVNDELILEVFDELTRAKPSVKRYLEILEEEEEEPDIRELADLIIRNYPWIIGVELRRLFSGSLRALDKDRLEQILTTIHRSLQFLAYLLIIELYERILDGSISVNPDFQTNFKSRFLELSHDDYLWIIAETNQVMKGIDRFIPELSENIDEQFIQGLELEIPKRDYTGGFKIELNEEELAKKCFEYQEVLTFILKRLAVLTPYKLVTIKEIKVLKTRREKALFEHWMDILSNNNSDFRSKEETFDSFSDSNSVLLMKSLKRPDHFLNLSPFIIDTRGESMDSREKFDLKKDIFVCEGLANNSLRYVGTEIAEECDLGSLSNYQKLVEEFRDITNLDGSAKGGES